MRTPRRRAGGWAMLAASTLGGTLLGATVPAAILVLGYQSGGPANSYVIEYIVAAFAMVFGGLFGLAAGLVTGLLVVGAAALTARLRVRTPVITAVAALSAAGAVYYFASEFIGEDGSFPATLAAVAGAAAAIGVPLLWMFGGSCRLCRRRALNSAV